MMNKVSALGELIVQSRIQTHEMTMATTGGALDAMGAHNTTLNPALERQRTSLREKDI